MLDNNFVVAAVLGRYVLYRLNPAGGKCMRALFATVLAIALIGVAYQFVPSILISIGLPTNLFVWVCMLSGAALGGFLIWLGILNGRKFDTEQ